MNKYLDIKNRQLNHFPVNGWISIEMWAVTGIRRGFYLVVLLWSFSFLRFIRDSFRNIHVNSQRASVSDIQMKPPSELIPSRQWFNVATIPLAFVPSCWRHTGMPFPNDQCLITRAIICWPKNFQSLTWKTNISIHFFTLKLNNFHLKNQKIKKWLFFYLKTF